MTHIPFGYCFKDGEPAIDDFDGPKVIQIFELYLQGHGLVSIGEAIGISYWHCGISRIISNRVYLGKGIYPRLITDETFAKAQHEKYVRAARLGRLNKKGIIRQQHIPVDFILESTECEIEDPILKAEYLYSKIREV